MTRIKRDDSLDRYLVRPLFLNVPADESEEGIFEPLHCRQLAIYALAALAANVSPEVESEENFLLLLCALCYK